MRRVFWWAYLQGFACVRRARSTGFRFRCTTSPTCEWSSRSFRCSLLAAIVAIYTAVAIWAGEFVARRTRIPAVLTMPIAWTAVEWIRTYFPIGFPVESARLHGVSQSRTDPVRRIHRRLRRFGADHVLQRRGLRRDFPPRRHRLQTVSLSALTAMMIAAGRVRRVANRAISRTRRADRQLQGRDGAGQYPAIAQVGSELPAAELTESTRTKPRTRRSAAPI